MYALHVKPTGLFIGQENLESNSTNHNWLTLGIDYWCTVAAKQTMMQINARNLSKIKNEASCYPFLTLEDKYLQMYKKYPSEIQVGQKIYWETSRLLPLGSCDRWIQKGERQKWVVHRGIRGWWAMARIVGETIELCFCPVLF